VPAGVGWVQQPKYKKGLDPLGVQQPCIAVYSSLLPGITNVTDRVAYYGFGPWFCWTFAKRYPQAKSAEFIAMLRRAEVLLALTGARHALATADGSPDQHDGALVGINTLRSIVSEAGTRTSIRLSQYSTLDDVEKRYFKNRRGGLGQYYLGVLREEYQLLGDHKSGVIDFTIERGRPMAEAVAAGVDTNRFFRALEADRVSIEDLDNLSCFCSCQLRTKRRQSERALLLDTVLGLRPDLSSNAEIRRRSIGLVIDFLRAAGGCEFSFSPENDFLIACYARVLPNGALWNLAAAQAKTADLWAFYFREELLSLAMQRLFRETLLAIDMRGPQLLNVETAGQWCAAVEPFVQITKKQKSYDTLLAHVKDNLVPLSDTDDAHHEIELWEKVTDVSGAPAPAVDAAISLVLTLVLRQQLASYNIERAIGENQIRLENYPINIDSIGARAHTRWPGMPIRDWMSHVLSWTMATHRQVALRKLSQSGDDTRRLRMGEHALYVYGDTIDVARTIPRLRPTLRFLHDLGLTTASESGHLPVPTHEALKILQQSHAS
jgi:hypothetical protein